MPKGRLLDVWNGGADMHTWGGEIIWALKFRGTKSATCALKFGGRPDYLGSDISCMTWPKAFS